MNKSRITQNKHILGGKPIIAGTRISVDLIISYLANGFDINAIKRDYPHLRDDQIKAAFDYIRDHVDREEVKLEPTPV